MQIIDLKGYKEGEYKTAVALGNFDGVHIGHQRLIKNNIERAIRAKLKPTVLLFTNHTKTILEKGQKHEIEILTSYKQKLNLMNGLGVDLVYTMDFNENIMNLTAEEFIKTILINKLNVKLVTVGFNYRFGYNAFGDSEYLKSLGNELGYNVNIIEPVFLNGEIISSSTIRNLIKQGNIENANSFLNRNYSILGKVIRGKNLGTKIGYPTANLMPVDNYVIPKLGVYKTLTKIDKIKYLSLTNIGSDPTLPRNGLSIENHILGFNKALYGETIQIEFLSFIRDIIKFSSVKDLACQIENDIGYVKKSYIVYNY